MRDNFPLENVQLNGIDLNFKCNAELYPIDTLQY